MRKVILLAVMGLAVLVSGCVRSGPITADQTAKTHGHFDYSQITFGKRGFVDVQAHKDINIAGRSLNYSEVLASVFRDVLISRGMNPSEVVPTKGGAYAYRESVAMKRDMFINWGWAKEGKIILYVSFELAPLNIKRKYLQPVFFTMKASHKDDEAFYIGLKAELLPIVERLWDEGMKTMIEMGLTEI